jgi:hypothetical protein
LHDFHGLPQKIEGGKIPKSVQVNASPASVWQAAVMVIEIIEDSGCFAHLAWAQKDLQQAVIRSKIPV